MSSTSVPLIVWKLASVQDSVQAGVVLRKVIGRRPFGSSMPIVADAEPELLPAKPPQRTWIRPETPSKSRTWNVACGLVAEKPMLKPAHWIVATRDGATPSIDSVTGPDRRFELSSQNGAIQPLTSEPKLGG